VSILLTGLSGLVRGIRSIFGLIERGIYLGAFVWLGAAIIGLIR
jgi:hypothetical protein